LKLAVGAVAPRPLLIEGLGEIGSGVIGGGAVARRAEIVERVLDTVSPIDDVRASGAYRRQMVAYLVTELLARLEQ